MALAVVVAGSSVGAWRKEPSLLAGRSAHAVVSTGDAIYALGGSGARGAVLDVERFDGRRWTVVTRLPQGLNAPAAVVLGGKIYVIGGFDGTSNVPTDRVDVYDLASRAWGRAAPLPAPRGGHAAVALDGKIHVLGGGNEVSTLADHSVYDPATNRWSRLASLRRSKGSPAAVVFGGRIYSVGGRSGNLDYGDVDIYDAGGDRWTRGPSIPPRGTHGAVVYRGSLYAFGGESQATGRTLKTVLRLRPGATRWQPAASMPTARNYARAVLFRDAVWVVGGSRTAGASHNAAGSRVVERFFVRRP
ncbi:MAG TPA: kelch repeat-containing protein [Gaiellaceae bacterium]|nr:kelch repeat-containing protein [Gaiellaceae bacterium]